MAESMAWMDGCVLTRWTRRMRWMDGWMQQQPVGQWPAMPAHSHTNPAPRVRATKTVTHSLTQQPVRSSLTLHNTQHTTHDITWRGVTPQHIPAQHSVRHRHAAHLGSNQWCPRFKRCGEWPGWSLCLPACLPCCLSGWMTGWLDGCRSKTDHRFAAFVMSAASEWKNLNTLSVMWCASRHLLRSRVILVSPGRIRNVTAHD
mmetsp:Transcript_48824/g.122273  ORF Transcript_48824/g.122273 Transcript_48824/m.122273 type:complete len:202 (-) Transcript_48824:1236-1841(-)